VKVVVRLMMDWHVERQREKASFIDINSSKRLLKSQDILILEAPSPALADPNPGAAQPSGSH
jgi:hypothetical protein